MRSVLTEERTAPIACDDRELGMASNPNVGGKLRRYKGKVESSRAPWLHLASFA